MSLRRNFEFADAQSRVRARLGAMPDLPTWQYLADAADLDVLIARMRARGLGHWVAALPRSPDVASIEEALFDGLHRWAEGLIRLLPARWSGLGRWMRRGIEIALERRPQRFEEHAIPTPRLDADRQMTAPTDRAENARAVRSDSRLQQEQATLLLWLADFKCHCPALTGREGYIVQRLLRSVDVHLRAVTRLRDRAASGEPLDLGAQWRLRERLADELRPLLCGDPFHAGFVLVYALLEMLNYEKCRALLIAGSHRWSASHVLGGRM